jgi:predicted transcriptional regulator
MPFSLRLDSDTEARIRRLTRLTGRSKAAVIRDAVAQYAAEGDLVTRGETAFDRLGPFVGVIDTGGAQLSSGTHAKYRAAVRAKRRGRAR